MNDTKKEVRFIAFFSNKLKSRMWNKISNRIYYRKEGAYALNITDAYDLFYNSWEGNRLLEFLTEENAKRIILQQSNKGEIMFLNTVASKRTVTISNGEKFFIILCEDINDSEKLNVWILKKEPQNEI